MTGCYLLVPSSCSATENFFAATSILLVSPHWWNYKYVGKEFFTLSLLGAGRKGLIKRMLNKIFCWIKFNNKKYFIFVFIKRFFKAFDRRRVQNDTKQMFFLWDILELYLYSFLERQQDMNFIKVLKKKKIKKLWN
jgi:hypothetical protein